METIVKTLNEGYNHLNVPMRVTRAAEFAKVYPHINSFLNMEGRFQQSRNGATMEWDDFKTELTEPLYRCVGTSNRNMNVFFLLAEAIWIFTGRKDVESLALFNAGMREFSDDGKVFHAPYGYRLRHWGQSSYTNKVGEEAIHSQAGVDQMRDVLDILQKDPNSRRAVMAIWNPDLDLNVSTKDLPCNDLVMVSVRDGGVRLTIENRSNDLHWGLPTNIFQFSFIGEILAYCLGYEYTGQVHNSKSLHLYKDIKITQNMLDSKRNDSLYDYVTPSLMDFRHITATEANRRLDKVTVFLNQSYDGLFDALHNIDRTQSEYFYVVIKMLWYYKRYKDSGDKSSGSKLKVIYELMDLMNDTRYCHDYLLMGINWMFNLVKKEDREQVRKYIKETNKFKLDTDIIGIF